MSKSTASMAKAFNDIRADWNMSRESRFVRRRTGLPSSYGASADWHYRNENDYYNDIEKARDMDRNDAVVGQTVDRAVGIESSLDTRRIPPELVKQFGDNHVGGNTMDHHRVIACSVQLAATQHLPFQVQMVQQHMCQFVAQHVGETLRLQHAVTKIIRPKPDGGP